MTKKEYRAIKVVHKLYTVDIIKLSEELYRLERAIKGSDSMRKANAIKLIHLKAKINKNRL